MWKMKNRSDRSVTHRPSEHFQPFYFIECGQMCIRIPPNRLWLYSRYMYNMLCSASSIFSFFFSSLNCLRHLIFAPSQPPAPPVTQILIESMQRRFYYFPFTPPDWITAWLWKCSNCSVITLRQNRYPSQKFHLENGNDIKNNST